MTDQEVYITIGEIEKRKYLGMDSGHNMSKKLRHNLHVNNIQLAKISGNAESIMHLLQEKGEFSGWFRQAHEAKSVLSTY
jgi:hypothetical protein